MPVRPQAGVALITAMLVVAIVATVAAYLALGQQVWLHQVQNSKDMAQARAVTRGAVDFSALLLAQDAKTNATDNLTQDWAKPLPPLPAGGGTVAATISDAQALFNLNNLEQPTLGDIATFRRLMTLLNLDPDLIDALMDWLDADSDRRPQGAEDPDYLSLDPPYRAANQPLQSVDELRWVIGFTPKVVRTLKPWVVALPQSTPVNVNTAPPEVLSAVCGVSMDLAQQWVTMRSSQPFTQATLPPCSGAPAASYGATSQYFMVAVQANFGDLHEATETLLYRPRTGPVTIMWREPVLPEIVLPGTADTP